MAESTTGYDPVDKVKRAPTPQEFLEQLHADFSSGAASKEAEARDLEDRMMFLRVEAAGLRKAAEGVREALDVYFKEMARTKEFRDVRDGQDQPVREAPYVGQQGPDYDSAMGRRRG